MENVELAFVLRHKLDIYAERILRNIIRGSTVEYVGVSAGPVNVTIKFHSYGARDNRIPSKLELPRDIFITGNIDTCVNWWDAQPCVAEQAIPDSNNKFLTEYAERQELARLKKKYESD